MEQIIIILGWRLILFVKYLYNQSKMVKVFEDINMNGRFLIFSDEVNFGDSINMNGHDIEGVDRIEGEAGYIDMDASGNIRINPTDSELLYVSGDLEVSGGLASSTLDCEGDIYTTDIMQKEILQPGET